eukprot:9478140-Pyramimonas_sp.AAC.1
MPVWISPPLTSAVPLNFQKRRRSSSAGDTVLTRSRDTTAHLAVSAEIVRDDLWQAVHDPSSGDVYYWHVETGETSWETPDGFQPSREGASISGAELVSSGNTSGTGRVAEGGGQGKEVPTSTADVSMTMLKDDTASGALGARVDSDATRCHDTGNGGRTEGSERLPMTERNVRGSDVAEIDDRIEITIDMVEPNSDQERALIVKTAKFVAEKGTSVEGKLLDQKKAQFGFLEPTNQLHGYYRYQVDLESVAFW